jgi:hypothetical protein
LRYFCGDIYIGRMPKEEKRRERNRKEREWKERKGKRKFRLYRLERILSHVFLKNTSSRIPGICSWSCFCGFSFTLFLCNQSSYLFVSRSRGMPTCTFFPPPHPAQSDYQGPVFCHLRSLTGTIKKSKLLKEQQVSLKNRRKSRIAISN